MASGSRVHFSAWDERGTQPAIWYEENSFVVNLNDGDEITGLIEWGEYVFPFKNNSIYRAKEYDRHTYTVEPFAYGVGCIAPRSLTHTPDGGIIFLHSSGLRKLTSYLQSDYKESGGSLPPPISEPIQDRIDGYSIDVQREAVVWYGEYEDDLILSFPTIDTSFVLSGGQWYTWNYAPKEVVSYDTAYEIDLRPITQKVFIMDSSAYIYKVGGVKTDNGDSILLSWKSREMYQTGGMAKILEWKLWRESNSTNGYAFNIYDEGDTVIATGRDTLSVRVKRKDIDCPEFKECQVEITSGADSLVIYRLDLNVRNTGPMPVE